MRLVVVGSLGMLGQDLVAHLQRQGFEVIGLDRSGVEPWRVDITQPEDLRAAVGRAQPQMVINCAAYTAVDKAESEPEQAMAVNRDGAASLAKLCNALAVPLVHISTDYVFSGESRRPYAEDDPAEPINVYGLSKWQGEEAIRRHCPRHLIVRISWLFGVHGANFVKTILRLAAEREELRVVADQHGCPTCTMDLAAALAAIAARIQASPAATPWGTYHFTNQGATTWYDFARAILDEGRRYQELRTTRVIPITTAEYPTPARRPQWSVLSCEKIGRVFQISPPSWRPGLAAVVAALAAGEDAG